MYKLILIGLGGLLGALLRYGVSGLAQNLSRSISFPYGTLVVNILGCLIIGALSQLAESRGLLSPEARVFIFIGLLGAFTTYSTFASESVNLLMDGENVLAMLNISLHIILGLGAVWIGRIAVMNFWR